MCLGPEAGWLVVPGELSSLERVESHVWGGVRARDEGQRLSLRQGREEPGTQMPLGVLRKPV